MQVEWRNLVCRKFHYQNSIPFICDLYCMHPVVYSSLKGYDLRQSAQ
jgi:hypothetical protein